MTAVTDDGRSHYVFKVDSDGYVFVQAESSTVELTDAGIGISVTDGARFVFGEAAQNFALRLSIIQ